MKVYVTTLLCSFLFAIGLGISGMLDPIKVLNFLDFTGTWDPTLIFVMASALAVTSLLYPVILRRDRPICEIEFVSKKGLPAALNIIIGASIFGIGWGLIGLCPGPTVCNVVIDGVPVLIFFTAMIASMVLFKVIEAKFFNESQEDVLNPLE